MNHDYFSLSRLCWWHWSTQLAWSALAAGFTATGLIACNRYSVRPDRNESLIPNLSRSKASSQKVPQVPGSRVCTYLDYVRM